MKTNRMSLMENLEPRVLFSAAAGYALAVQDLTGNAITSIQVGQSFRLVGYTQDLRSTASGVFAGYVDVTYNAALVQATSSLSYGGSYSDVRSGDTSVAGLINEVGGVDGSATPLGGGQVQLFSMTFRALSAGTVVFQTNPADAPGHETLLLGGWNPETEVSYGSVSLTVGSQAQPPDLTTTSGTYTGALYLPYGQFNVSAKITNNGESAAGGFNVQVRLSKNKTWADGDDVIVGSTAVSSLDASSVKNLSGSFAIPAAAAGGSFYVGIMVDSGNAVGESSESNNVWWSSAANVQVANPGLWFDESYYLWANPDVRAVVGKGFSSGYDHFLQFGLPEGRRPTAYFDAGYYVATYPDVKSAIASGKYHNAFEEYVVSGAAMGRDPSAFFSERYYGIAYADIGAAVNSGVLVNGLQHYMAYGDREGRNPSAFFRESAYRAANSDVSSALAAGTYASGFDHYMRFGWTEHRTCTATAAGGHPIFDEAYYLAIYPDVRAAVAAGTYISGMDHFIRSGQYEGRYTTFSETRYKSLYPDVAAAIQAHKFASGLDHFLQFGLAEGRNRSPFFVESSYLAKNPDVAAAVHAGLFESGFEHYIWFGQSEGRNV